MRIKDLKDVFQHENHFLEQLLEKKYCRLEKSSTFTLYMNIGKKFHIAISQNLKFLILKEVLKSWMALVLLVLFLKSWGYLWGSTVGDLVKIEWTMKKEYCKKTSVEQVITFGNRLIGQKFTFWHDNNPKHNSKLCKNYLANFIRKKVTYILIWPPQ